MVIGVWDAGNAPGTGSWHLYAQVRRTRKNKEQDVVRTEVLVM